jgi:hypothetical protein
VPGLGAALSSIGFGAIMASARSYGTR